MRARTACCTGQRCGTFNGLLRPPQTPSKTNRVHEHICKALTATDLQQTTEETAISYDGEALRRAASLKEYVAYAKPVAAANGPDATSNVTASSSSQQLPQQGGGASSKGRKLQQERVAVLGGEDFIYSQQNGVEVELFKGSVLGVNADVASVDFRQTQLRSLAVRRHLHRLALRSRPSTLQLRFLNGDVCAGHTAYCLISFAGDCLPSCVRSPGEWRTPQVISADVRLLCAKLQSSTTRAPHPCSCACSTCRTACSRRSGSRSAWLCTMRATCSLGRAASRARCRWCWESGESRLALNATC